LSIKQDRLKCTYDVFTFQTPGSNLELLEIDALNSQLLNSVRKDKCDFLLTWRYKAKSRTFEL